MEILNFSASSATGILTLEDLKRKYTLAILGANKGNRTRTARDLGIGIRTLQRHLNKWGESGGRGDRTPKAVTPTD